jgi:hypothetical protein
MDKNIRFYNLRIISSYLLAKAYQFCGTFPKTGNIIIPEKYSTMNWWHLTHFLCLLSNKLYPLRVADGMLSAVMTYAIKDKVNPDMEYEDFVKLIRKDEA